jgi:hypothetical protein
LPEFLCVPYAMLMRDADALLMYALLMRCCLLLVAYCP